MFEWHLRRLEITISQKQKKRFIWSVAAVSTVPKTDVQLPCIRLAGRPNNNYNSYRIALSKILFGKGPSIYDVHKKSNFLPPPFVHMRPHEPDSSSPRVDVHMQST